MVYDIMNHPTMSDHADFRIEDSVTMRARIFMIESIAIETDIPVRIINRSDSGSVSSWVTGTTVG